MSRMIVVAVRCTPISLLPLHQGALRCEAHFPASPQPPEPFDDDDLTFEKSYAEEVEWDETSDKPETGDRWSTWDLSTPTGARPAAATPTGSSPSWPRSTPSTACSRPARRPTSSCITRAVPGTDRACLLVGQALPQPRPPHVPPRRRLPGGPAGQGVPGQPGHGQPQRLRQGGHRRAVGGGRVRRADAGSGRSAQQLGVEPFVPYPVQILGTEVLHGVHRRARRHGRAAAGARCAATTPAWPTCGSRWCWR